MKKIEYDESGYIIKESYYDTKGNLTIRGGIYGQGFAVKVYKYYDNHDSYSITLYDTEGNIVEQ